MNWSNTTSESWWRIIDSTRTRKGGELFHFSYLKNIQADVAGEIHIWMEADSVKLHLWRLEWVISGEDKRELVDCALINCVLTASDRSSPAKDVVSLGEGWYASISTHLIKKFGSSRTISQLIIELQFSYVFSLLTINAISSDCNLFA